MSISIFQIALLCFMVPFAIVSGLMLPMAAYIWLEKRLKR